MPTRTHASKSGPASTSAMPSKSKRPGWQPHPETRPEEAPDPEAWLQRTELLGHSLERMIAKAPAPAAAEISGAETGVVQRTEEDGVRKGQSLYEGSESIGNWQDVMRVKSSFSDEQWSQIVSAYNRGGGSTGLRLRNVRRGDASESEPSVPQSSTSTGSSTLATAIDGASYTELAQTAFDTVAPSLADNPVSHVLHDLAPPIATLSSAKSARAGFQEAQRGISTGNTVYGIRHGIAATADSVNSLANLANTPTFGLNPVLKGVSLAASGVKHLAKLPEHLQTARHLYHDRHDLGETASEIYQSPSQTVSAIKKYQKKKDAKKND